VCHNRFLIVCHNGLLNVQTGVTQGKEKGGKEGEKGTILCCAQYE
jgi:hypothetical protein